MNIKARHWLPLVVIVLCLVIPPTPIAAQGTTTHIVQRGETLSQIARRYGTTVGTLMQVNGLRNANFVWWGQRLRIPSSHSTPAPSTARGYHIVQRGETLSQIARRYGTTVSALMQANGLRNPNFVWWGQRLRLPGSASTPTSPPPSTTTRTHVVQRGETLARIALRYGTTVTTLVRANGLPNANRIYVGQRLTIPAAGSAPAPAPAPSPPAAAPTGGKWIDIDLSSQRLTAYVGNTAVQIITVSTGLPRTPTPRGRYTIRYKVRSTPMSGPGYYLPGVPWVMVFYGAYSIHGTYWHNNFGVPMSHGCVNMKISQAKWLFNWAPRGTLVVVHQ